MVTSNIRQDREVQTRMYDCDKTRLQGPIMGGTFGVVIGNRQLMQLGIVNEVIGLVICLVVGK